MERTLAVPLKNVNKIGKQFYVDAKLFDRKIRFLVDTGSQLNLICHKNVPKNIKIIKTQIEVNDYSGGRINSKSISRGFTKIKKKRTRNISI